jgi:mannose-6-phosphate isomerase-like protein (cupin superfamily)
VSEKVSEKPHSEFFGGPGVGEDGSGWCVRPAQLGLADTGGATQLQWLIVPGPPISCYLASIFPRADPSPMEFYHSHPESWSLHVVIAGAGHQYVEGVPHLIGPGDVLFHGPNVRHSLVPLPNTPLAHLAIQHPHIGYSTGSWQIRSDAGTAKAFGDVAAFVERFGAASGEELAKALRAESMWTSERWKKFVMDRTAAQRPTP